MEGDETFKILKEKIANQENYTRQSALQKLRRGASLVAQWLRVRLPMQGTQVRALVWEDPTCRGAAGPVSHSY